MQEEKQPDELEQTGEDVAQVKDTEALRKALAEEETKAEKYLDNWKRAQADFVNFKRRSEQEKGETSKFANSVLILNLLPVLDDLERALGSVPPRLAKLPWVEGIRLIERKFHAILESQGVTKIKAKGIRPLLMASGSPAGRPARLMMYSSASIPAGVIMNAVSAAIKAILRPFEEANHTPAVSE